MLFTKAFYGVHSETTARRGPFRLGMRPFRSRRRAFQGWEVFIPVKETSIPGVEVFILVRETGIPGVEVFILVRETGDAPHKSGTSVARNPEKAAK